MRDKLMDAFFIENDELSEKYNTIWNKVSNDIKRILTVNLSLGFCSQKKMKTIIHKSFKRV